jgi:hypothetical protein
MADQTLIVRTGTMRIPFERNHSIALNNFLAGRPLFDGQLPAVYVPDPILPEWLIVKVID